MVKVKRISKIENRYHPNMGSLSVRVIRIHKTFMGIKFKELHRYRETYHGRIKDCDDCRLAVV